LQWQISIHSERLEIDIIEFTRLHKSTFLRSQNAISPLIT